MEQPKYEYHVRTWGGFYNEEYQSVHKKESGDFWFDTIEARRAYIDELRQIEQTMNARHLALTTTEGFCCRIRTVCHRVIEFDGKQYYTTSDLGVNCSFSVAEYWMSDKWYPGFNDEPLGEDFDYTKVKVVAEWITGAHQEFETI